MNTLHVVVFLFQEGAHSQAIIIFDGPWHQNVSEQKC